MITGIHLVSLLALKLIMYGPRRALAHDLRELAGPALEIIRLLKAGRYYYSPDRSLW